CCVSHCFFMCFGRPRYFHLFPTRRSSDLERGALIGADLGLAGLDEAHPAGEELHPQVELRLLPVGLDVGLPPLLLGAVGGEEHRSEEHTSELQSRENLVCRLLLEKKKYKQ